MISRPFLNFSLILLSVIFISCGGGKPAAISSSVQKSEPTKLTAASQEKFKYRFYFGSLGSLTKPHDNIWIDTAGQMTFDTEQQLKSGGWKSPRGMSFLEPKDEDTLLFFIKQDALFTIEEADVSPQCPDGDIYTIIIYRTDIKKQLSVKTNTCAPEFNLLTGQQRKIFPALLAFIDRIRDRYRPLFTD